MIHPIPHRISDGLRKENASHAEALAGWDIEVFRRQFPTAQSYASAFLATAEGRQFAHVLRELPPGSKVLDIGPGYGRSAIYLAGRGYRVAAVEPAPALCQLIDRLAGLYEFALDVYHAPAEAIDQLPEKDFDACVFSASLHHCDDPLKALTNCYEVLAPGGRLFILNEPQLHFFRSKRWFARQLEQGTLVTGDYGGNEHTYYHHEYRAMLHRAGFRQVRGRLSNRYREPDGYLGYLRAQGNGSRSIRLRQLYYRAVRLLDRGPRPGRTVLDALKRLSLVQTYFTARRP
jgi:SAM-dependent methyltransferase